MSTAEKFLKLEEELKRFRLIMKKASTSLLDQEVTKYPIFALHKQELELGVILVARDNDNSPWSIHVSTLEEFNVKGLIPDHKIKDFVKVYKDPEEFHCLFVISELGAQFIFLPSL